MADTKITALAPIGAIDPANDVLPIVDVSNNSMAASGTTCRVTTNQLLQANAIASLASATISGDLTVDTSTLKVDSANNRVGVNTASPATDLEVRANGNAEGTIRLYSAIDGSTASPKGSYFSFRSGTTGGGTETARLSSLNRFANVLGGDFSISTADTSSVMQNRLTIDSGGVFTFAVGGSTAMTLNSTGLGVGVSPSYKFDVLGSATISGRFKTSGALNALYLEDSGTTAGTLYIGTSGNEFRIVTGSNVALAVDVNRNFAIGPTSVTTTATDGFVYVPVCAGAPTGTPTAKGGRAAFVVDSTNNRFYVYVGGAWKYAALV